MSGTARLAPCCHNPKSKSQGGHGDEVLNEATADAMRQVLQKRS